MKRHYALALRRHPSSSSPSTKPTGLTAMFNTALDLLRQSGRLDALKYKWWTASSECKPLQAGGDGEFHYYRQQDGRRQHRVTTYYSRHHHQLTKRASCRAYGGSPWSLSSIVLGLFVGAMIFRS